MTLQGTYPPKGVLTSTRRYMMNIREEARKMKLVAPVLAASSNEMRNGALRAIAEALTARKDEIFAANAQDCQAAAENGIAQAVMKRLVFNDAKLNDVCKGIDQLITLPDPIGKSLLKRGPHRRDRCHFRGEAGCSGTDFHPLPQERQLRDPEGR